MLLPATPSHPACLATAATLTCMSAHAPADVQLYAFRKGGRNRVAWRAGAGAANHLDRRAGAALPAFSTAPAGTRDRAPTAQPGGHGASRHCTRMPAAEVQPDFSLTDHLD